jgi:hypothetical protein
MPAACLGNRHHSATMDLPLVLARDCTHKNLFRAHFECGLAVPLGAHFVPVNPRRTSLRYLVSQIMS